MSDDFPDVDKGADGVFANGYADFLIGAVVKIISIDAVVPFSLENGGRPKFTILPVNIRFAQNIALAFPIDKIIA